MAQSGFTPISIYYSSTASNVPTAANLVPGELAINTNDGKLYYEDSSGVVRVLASKSTGTIGGSTTQVQYNSSGSLAGSANFVFDGTNVGIGTSSPSVALEVAGSAKLTNGNLSVVPSTGTNAAYLLTSNTGGGFFLGVDTSTGASFTGTAYGRFLYSGGAYPMIFFTNDTERMRIDSSGNLLWGKTSQVLNGNLSVLAKTSSNAAAFESATSTVYPILNLFGNEGSGNQIFTRFSTDSNAERGSITYNRGAGLVAYNVTSDYRAKDISGLITDSGSVIDAIPVYMGKMKGATQERPMFIAHETPEYAHTGKKDAVDADGNPVYQQMDASALIPVMWAEIQSLRQRIATLENK